jgi:cell division protein FtsI (penicillin-binding protein 3)
VLSFEDVIIKSSNVGTIQAVSRFGDRRAERLMHWVRKYGFGERSSPDFPGESPGIVWDPARLNDSALASVAIGYQISVTPLQMAAAFSAVANGGELLQPRVVRAVIRDGKRAIVPRKVLRRVISPSTAAELTRIMEGVVTDGTAKGAQLPSYTVAGKTGTAQKVVNRAYSRTDYNVSFVGFVPSRNPVFTIAVVVDTPRGVPAYGSTVAVPIFRRIADASLRQFGVAPNIDPQPPVLLARNEETGVHERPAAGPLRPPAVITVRHEAGADGGFPDLTGMSAREALRALTKLGVRPVMHGAGVVVDQRPAAGSHVGSGVAATVWLRRRQPVETTGIARP